MGDLPKLKRLYAREPQYLAQGDYDDRFPIHIACANGHIPVVTWLCKEVLTVDQLNAHDRWGRTAADDCQTAHPAHVELLELLARHGVQPATPGRASFIPDGSGKVLDEEIT